MKKQHPTIFHKKIFLFIFILFLTLFSVIIILIVKNNLLRLLYWKTYSNPSMSFSFRYPPDWFIYESYNPDYGSYSAVITSENTYHDIRALSDTVIRITDENLTTNENDIRQYLVNYKLATKEKRGNIIETYPGYTYFYGFETYDKSFFPFINASVAKVEDHMPHYMILNKGKVYSVFDFSIDDHYEEENKFLLWSLKFRKAEQITLDMPIAVYDYGTHDYFGDIRIENSQIISSLKTSDIQTYVLTHKDYWEQSTLQHPIIETKREGLPWSGPNLEKNRTQKSTTIRDDDHLISIYYILREVFKNKYSFEFEKMYTQ